MKLKLQDITIKSFVTSEEITGGLEVNQVDKTTIQPFTRVPCSAIDACPSAWICPVTEDSGCKSLICL
jgi:hypothetical protein